MAPVMERATRVAAREEERPILHQLDQLFGRQEIERRTVIVGPDDERIELPASAFQLLRQVVRLLAEDQAVVVVPDDHMLTTQQAADILNVSRPHVVRLLERGEIPYEQIGTHRRIRVGDLMEFKHNRYIRRRRALDAMARESQEDGEYFSGAAVSSFAVVLDACVLVPDSLRDALLRAANEDLYRPFWSETILGEVERAMGRRPAGPEGAKRRIDRLRLEWEEALVEHVDLIEVQAAVDPKDLHVLATAVKANAQVIVTRNERDFPEPALAPLNIEAQTPDVFLCHLFSLAPSTMLAILDDQAAALTKPPITLTELLAKLQVHAPTFVAQVHDFMNSSGEDRILGSTGWT